MQRLSSLLLGINAHITLGHTVRAGRGVFALQPLSEGITVLSQPPLATASRSHADDLPPKLKALDEELRVAKLNVPRLAMV